MSFTAFRKWLAGLLAGGLLLGGAYSAWAVERWGLYEAAFPGPTTGKPYLEVQLSATFNQGLRHLTVPGFWDGGGNYKLRFMPPTTGEWRYGTGNFSATMSSYGLDRQFRGEIRGLQIYGSRMSARGALVAKEFTQQTGDSAGSQR